MSQDNIMRRQRKHIDVSVTKVTFAQNDLTQYFMKKVFNLGIDRHTMEAGGGGK